MIAAPTPRVDLSDMGSLSILSAVDQVSGHLRKELIRGSLSGTMPGVGPLAKELGVNHKTVRAALKQLEDEGLLADQGKGMQRRIVLPKDHAPTALRVALMASDLANESYIVELRHLLEKEGHTPFHPAKTLRSLGMDARRVSRFVQRIEADAWVVLAGSRSVVNWFAEQETPAFALFGRHTGLPIAAVRPDKVPPYRSVIRHLHKLGHTRIVLLAREERRFPEPGRSERAFLDELEANGLPTGNYNLPDWEESSEGYQELLGRLFRHTPPTALIVQEGQFITAALQFCNRNCIRVPEDLSLVCTDPDPSFTWCQPSIAHIRWDYQPVIRRIVQWANNVAKGKEDHRQTLTKAEFIEGGTIGQASQR